MSKDKAEIPANAHITRSRTKQIPKQRSKKQLTSGRSEAGGRRPRDLAERTELRSFSPTRDRSIPPPWRKSKERNSRGPGLSNSWVGRPPSRNEGIPDGSRRISAPASGEIRHAAASPTSHQRMTRTPRSARVRRHAVLLRWGLSPAIGSGSGGVGI